MEGKEYEAVACVYKTTDYNSFKKLEGNREIVTSRKNKILNSIDSVGYVVPSPIIVNKNMEVIDGQGRLEACIERGLPIYFVISENAGINECMAMNIGQVNWNIRDYVHCYAEMNNENYMRLEEAHKTYPQFTIAELFGVFTNKIVNSGYPTKVIKNGDFVLDEEMYRMSKSVFDYLLTVDDVLQEIPGSSRVKRTGVAWIIVNTECDRNRLRMKLQKMYPIIKPVVDTSPVLFLNQLSDIYNKGLSKGKCQYFDVAYKQAIKS